MLTDINDNVPSFSRSSYETVISVLDTGNVLRVMASDPDCDANGDIHYSFTSGKKMKSDLEKYVFSSSYSGSLSCVVVYCYLFSTNQQKFDSSFVVNGSSLFEINSTTGNISVVKPLVSVNIFKIKGELFTT